MDGDGSIHKQRNVIHYRTISQELSKQLSILLQHFDIHCNKYIVKDKKGGMVNGREIRSREPFFNLEFRSEYSKLLGKELKLSNKVKYEKLKALLNNKLGKSNYEGLPYGSLKIFQ